MSKKTLAALERAAMRVYRADTLQGRPWMKQYYSLINACAAHAKATKKGRK